MTLEVQEKEKKETPEETKKTEEENLHLKDPDSVYPVQQKQELEVRLLTSSFILRVLMDFIIITIIIISVNFLILIPPTNLSLSDSIPHILTYAHTHMCTCVSTIYETPPGPVDSLIV